ncbi:hypothetical protein P167DRAFT_282795 [Morchella conica CCBAS932]|uniref:Uncharacterized protein n=1 Tax=Morchella conica CCBAS932 TaxID=1392247 RepID=A0A3N4KKF2_9PEZI|nr:hypothetical protein P167DRAFT_282795 [Morchella conica CCBAS932]
MHPLSPITPRPNPQQPSSVLHIHQLQHSIRVKPPPLPPPTHTLHRTRLRSSNRLLHPRRRLRRATPLPLPLPFLGHLRRGTPLPLLPIRFRTHGLGEPSCGFCCHQERLQRGAALGLGHGAELRGREDVGQRVEVAVEDVGSFGAGSVSGARMRERRAHTRVT